MQIPPIASHGRNQIGVDCVLMTALKESIIIIMKKLTTNCQDTEIIIRQSKCNDMELLTLNFIFTAVGSWPNFTRVECSTLR